jgi:hypothetical protein
MTPDRRRFLIGAIATVGAGLSRRLFGASLMPGASGEASLDAAQLSCLRAWLDTLLPSDEFSPAASELGVLVSIAADARDDWRLLEVIARGCRWLDIQARHQGAQGFTQLDLAERERVAMLADQSGAGSVARMFFEHTREHAFRHYYAQPASWKMLNYAGPPQPLGFMDQALPPSGLGTAR